ncbi:hypothetical protein FFK22_037075 [Mycobacterium sp. KBS0706]|uniref:hypothetical protein n=1 Tax=Mycobacterium sp. KBS0706 TaxID=2578109 RepID=UPI00110F8060|nr:hypothetical protein [Mycobacterium sp. KBS0706]TSD83565.1 hypothetical protein FFK22_037075 [Mycobacterium sp. KBS0706]
MMRYDACAAAVARPVAAVFQSAILERQMSDNVWMRCDKTGKPFDTMFALDQRTIEQAKPGQFNFSNCPHCGGDHSILAKDVIPKPPYMA